jgi:hypothetical protein
MILDWQYICIVMLVSVPKKPTTDTKHVEAEEMQLNITGVLLPVLSILK